MIFDEKEIKLKDGTSCIIRSPEENDAEKLLDYLHIVSDETHYLVSYPEEITLTLAMEKDYINKFREDKDKVMINAYINGELAGNTSINPIAAKLKLKHRCSLGIAIKKKFWSNGIGNALIQAAIQSAKEIGYEQVELGVYADNKKAQKLYEKYGFELWGCTKNAFKLKDGTYCDDLTMGKFL